MKEFKNNIYFYPAIYFVFYILLLISYYIWGYGTEETNTGLGGVYKAVAGWPLIFLILGILLLVMFTILCQQQASIQNVVTIILSLYFIVLLCGTIHIKIEAYNKDHIQGTDTSEEGKPCNILFDTDKIYSNFGNIIYLILFNIIIIYFIYWYVKNKGTSIYNKFIYLTVFIFILFLLAWLIDLLFGWILSGGSDKNYIDTMDIYSEWIQGSQDIGTSEDRKSPDPENDRNAWKIFARLVGLLILIAIPGFIYFSTCDTKTTKDVAKGKISPYNPIALLCNTNNIHKIIICLILFIVILPISIKYLFSDECLFQKIKNSHKGTQIGKYRWSCIIQKYGGLHNIHLLIILGLILIFKEIS